MLFKILLSLHGTLVLLLLAPIDAVKHKDRDPAPPMTAYKDNSIRSYYDFSARRQRCREAPSMEGGPAASSASFIFTGTIRDVFVDPRGHDLAQVEVKRVIKGSKVLDQLPALYVEGKYASIRHRVVAVHSSAGPGDCVNALRPRDTWIFFTNLGANGELHLNASLLRLSLANIVQTEAAVKDKNHTHLPKIMDNKPVLSCEWKFCPFGGQCSVNHETKTFECKCIETCPETSAPVCGSDNVTYDNECRLLLTSCLQQRRIRLLWNESCESHGLCQNVNCGFGAKCVASKDGQSAHCQCPEQCSSYGSREETDESRAVCSDEGEQFDSLCHLLKTSCQQTKDIRIRNFGKCDPCWNVQCSFHAVCVTDGQTGPRCECISNCTGDDRSVCGSDGQTYRNRCEMELAACGRQMEITVAENTVCVNPCEDVVCKYGTECLNGTCSCPTACPSDDRPVCASDRRTHQNECEMMKTACYLNTPLTVLYHDECSEMSGSGEFCDPAYCQFGGQCVQQEDEVSRCVCSFDCGAVRSLVCGSDGMTYSSKCYLKEASCKKQMDIRIQAIGHCEGFEEDLCDGNETLVNPSTALEYDCAPGRETCPVESYCHVVGNVSRCCLGMFGQVCNDTKFGCCPDGTTVALGPDHAGCSSDCRCHPLGSLSADCDPDTGECQCKTGVGGLKCERCESNFWGMPKIAEGNEGCIPCECNANGSIREDCEQMTGQCICRQFAFGPKCNTCADGSEVTETGCSDNGTAVDEAASVNHEGKTTSENNSPLHWTPLPGLNYLLSTVKYRANDRPTPVDYLIPSFSGSSFIQLLPLQHGVLGLSIEIEFRTLALDGILLYTGQNADGREDFISIALRNGYVEFRYDLGSGATLLQTSKQVTLKKLHKVTATRIGKDGLLKLDEGSEASAVSPGSLRSLNIGIPLYLGYVPDLTEQIAMNIGTANGFVGCVQMLRIASPEVNKEYELTKASEDIEADNEITECDLQSCRTVLCENGGICSHRDHLNYTCTCPFGFTGVLCEFRITDGF